MPQVSKNSLNSSNRLILSFCPSWFWPQSITFSLGILFNTRAELARSLQYVYLEAIKIQIWGNVGNSPFSLHQTLRSFISVLSYMSLMLALVVYCCISAFSKFWDVIWMSSVADSYNNPRTSLLNKSPTSPYSPPVSLCCPVRISSP